jgi:hypothetical protein
MTNFATSELGEPERSRWHGRVFVVALLVVAALGTSVAFASWLASGTGSGSAKARVAQPLTTLSATASPTLYPGGTGDFVITIGNPNPYPVTVTSISANGPITSDHEGCDAPTHGVSFTDQTGVFPVPANGSATFTLAAAVAMADTSPEACQGATFTIPVKLSGGSGTTPPTTTTTTTTTTTGTSPPGTFAANNETDTAAEADFCNVQFPPSITGPAGLPIPPIFGRVYEPGLTTASSPSSIVAQLGYGPANTDPRTASGWTWVSALFNAQPNGTDDEYRVILTVPTPGSYSYSYRFSIDGITATYCDLDGAGSNPGLTFDLTQLGVLTVNAT